MNISAKLKVSASKAATSPSCKTLAVTLYQNWVKMKKINLKLINILFFMLLISCNSNVKFEKIGWNKKGDLNSYPNREKMLNDLMENYKIQGLNYAELVNLLGEPENYSDDDAGVIYYNIITDYGSNIDPVCVKNLKIKLDKNQKVERYIVEEIK